LQKVAAQVLLSVSPQERAVLEPELRAQMVERSRRHLVRAARVHLLRELAAVQRSPLVLAVPVLAAASAVQRQSIQVLAESGLPVRVPGA
jgi:hypothetical protein